MDTEKLGPLPIEGRNACAQDDLADTEQQHEEQGAAAEQAAAVAAATLERLEGALAEAQV